MFLAKMISSFDALNVLLNELVMWTQIDAHIGCYHL